MVARSLLAAILLTWGCGTGMPRSGMEPPAETRRTEVGTLAGLASRALRLGNARSVLLVLECPLLDLPGRPTWEWGRMEYSTTEATDVQRVLTAFATSREPRSTHGQDRPQERVHEASVRDRSGKVILLVEFETMDGLRSQYGAEVASALRPIFDRAVKEAARKYVR